MESIGRSLAIYMEKLTSVSGLNKGILMETTIRMQACDGRKIPVCTMWTLLQSPRLRKKRKGGKKDCCNSKSMTLLGEANQMRVWALGLGSASRWEWGEPEWGKKQDGRVGTSHLGWIRKVIRRAQESVWGSGRSPFPKNSRLVCQQGVQMRTIRGGLWGAGASSTSAA